MTLSEMSVAQARMESIKAGVLGAGAIACVALLLQLCVLWLPADIQAALAQALVGPRVDLFARLLNIGVAVASGFFFGVTYRYIVRQDDNLHLGGGAVGAFALVRSLARIEATWDGTFALSTWLMVTGVSFLWFVVARYVLDWAIAKRAISTIN